MKGQIAANVNVGMSEASSDEIRRAHAVCPLTAVQSRYSMMSRKKEEDTFPTIEELEIGFVAFSPLANGPRNHTLCQFQELGKWKG